MGCCASSEDEDKKKKKEEKEKAEFTDLDNPNKTKKSTKEEGKKSKEAPINKYKSETADDAEPQVAAAREANIEPTPEKSGQAAVAEAPPPPVATVAPPRAPRQTLELTEEELEAERELREAQRPKMQTKVMDMLVDQGGDEINDDDIFVGVSGEEVVEAFGAGFSPPGTPSPKKQSEDAGDSSAKKALETSSKPAPTIVGHRLPQGRIPDSNWYKARNTGEVPPTIVSWHQGKGHTIHIEIAPAHPRSSIYEFDEQTQTLTYACDYPPEVNLLGATGSSSSDHEDDVLKKGDVILYLTTITSSNEVRDRCRSMELTLSLLQVTEYHSIDISEMAYLRKKLLPKIPDCEKEKKPYLADTKNPQFLPLLFVGMTYIGDWERVEALRDDGVLLQTLKAAGWRPPSPLAEVANQDTVKHYVELPLFASLKNVVLEVSSDGAKFRFHGEKKEKGKYWAQLIQGPRAELNKLEWLKKDTSKEVENSDDDDLDAEEV